MSHKHCLSSLQARRLRDIFREEVHTLPRRVFWSLAVLAGLVTVSAAPSRAQQTQPATDFVILKREAVAPSSVRLSIIVVSSQSEADSVRGELGSGASFGSLATQHSKHPSAATGGEFGVFAIEDLRLEFRTGLERVKNGSYSDVIAIQRLTPSDWPEALPLPGASLKNVELTLGRSYASATLPADGQSTMTELTYPFGVRMRIHETRGLGFMEFTPPWPSSIFGIRPDDQIPSSIYDLFPKTGRFIRGVFVGVPGHPNWFIDVDDRADAVSRLLFVDRNIYGDLPGIPKSH